MRGPTIKKFGKSPVNELLESSGLESIIRAHEVQEHGYTNHCWNGRNNPPPVITIFSAPNYGGAHGNHAAVMIYKGGFLEPYKYYESPIPKVLPDDQDLITWSIPFVCSMVVSMMKVCVDKI